MKILVLTPQPLLPLHDGLNLRVYHLFREMARSHDIWVLFLAEGEISAAEEGVGKMAFQEVRGVPIRGEGGAPFRHCRDFAPGAAQAIRKLLQEIPIDVIVAESVYMVPYALRLCDRPVLVDLVDDMSLLVRRSIWGAAHWADRARRLRAWYFWRGYERRTLPAFPQIIVTSPRDARAVRRHAPRAQVSVVPNGVDTDVFQPPATRPSGPEVVFTGVMGFGPNEAAAIHFYTRIFPRVRAEIPAVRLTIAGKGPTARLQRLVGNDPSVVLTGYVEDIRPYLGRATVYVAPMVSGSGIKNKILEAWAMARPVVATPLACEGLEGVPGDTHLVADSPAAFAATVIHLLKDTDLGDEVGRRAHRLVLERYQWSVQAQCIGRLLEHISRHWPPAVGDYTGHPSLGHHRPRTDLC